MIENSLEEVQAILGLYELIIPQIEKQILEYHPSAFLHDHLSSNDTPCLLKEVYWSVDHQAVVMVWRIYTKDTTKDVEIRRDLSYFFVSENAEKIIDAA